MGKTPYKEYLECKTYQLRIEDGVVSSEKTIELSKNQTNMEFSLLFNAIVDIEGNVYQTVKIGNQEWMAENLRVTRFNDGTEISNIRRNDQWKNSTDPAYCYYKNRKSNSNKYGILYNWYVVNTGKLCPEGWHVPSDDDLTELENYLANNGFSYDGGTGVIGKYQIAKALANENDWESSEKWGSVGSTDYPDFRNKSGFSALPGGRRCDIIGFRDIGRSGYWWIFTKNTKTLANYWSLRNYSTGLSRSMTRKITDFLFVVFGISRFWRYFI